MLLVTSDENEAEVVALSLDVEAMVLSDPIVELLLSYTCRHYFKHCQPTWTTRLTDDVAANCDDITLSRMKVRNPVPLTQHGRLRELQLTPIRTEILRALRCTAVQHGHSSVAHYLFNDVR
jgi:hypothetical protein